MIMIIIDIYIYILTAINHLYAWYRRCAPWYRISRLLGEKCAPRSQNTRLRLDIRKTLLNGTIFEMEDNKVPGPKIH